MKEADMERMLKPLANRRRLAVLKFLHKRRVANVGEIAEHLRLSLPATSRHLRLLENAHFLEKDQHGLEMHYRLSIEAPLLTQYVLKLL